VNNIFINARFVFDFSSNFVRQNNRLEAEKKAAAQIAQAKDERKEMLKKAKVLFCIQNETISMRSCMFFHPFCTKSSKNCLRQNF